MRTIFIWLAFALVNCTSVRAEPTLNDFQLWSLGRFTAPVKERLDVSAEGMLSFTDQSSRLGQVLLRGILTYQIAKQFSVGTGYTYFSVDDGIGGRYKEHRILQDLNLGTSGQGNATSFTLRTRFEERYREGLGGVSLRMRQLTRLDVALPGREFRLVAWNEGFIAINHTEWSGSPGLSFMFNFLGMAIPLSNKVSIEPGYLNQAFLDRGDGRVRHILAIFVFARA